MEIPCINKVIVSLSYRIVKVISLWTKIRIFNSNAKSVILYGSETWRLTKKIITQRQTFTNRRLRYILGVWWPKKISNEELWQCIKQERIEVTIRRRKWRWIGHTLRKPTTNITACPLSGTLKGSGGQVLEITDLYQQNPSIFADRSFCINKDIIIIIIIIIIIRRTIQKEYENLGMSWDEVKRTAKNRVRWKAVVEALCSGRSEED